MTYLLLKAAVSGVIVMAVSEFAKRSPAVGGLVASLPLISLLAMIWLWRDTADPRRIADLAEGTFWYILPSLPLFLVLPALLRRGVGFWSGLTTTCALTALLYGAMAALVHRWSTTI